MNCNYTSIDFLRAVFDADNDKAVAALRSGVDVNAADPLTGLTALHLAVGTNNLPLTRVLVEDWNAAFKPDVRGRWPTLIAAQSRVGRKLSDYIVVAEDKAMKQSDQNLTNAPNLL